MKINLQQKLLGAAALFVMLSATQANAQTTDTRNLNVTATVPTVCMVDSAATIDMAFDLSDLLSRTLDYVLDVTLDWRCSNTVPVAIALGGADANNRAMTGGPAPLPYSLTDDLNVVWGDGSNGATDRTDAGLGMGIPSQVNTVIRGRILIADAQAAGVGAYSDSVLISFTY